jgi:tetratricopeptide (TPR) repeat protein
MGRLAVAALLLVAVAARAEEDPATEIAKGHFHTGIALYNAEQYQRAIVEFEAARELKPLAAFDYNIARCYDRLDRKREAIAEYRRYVERKPPPDDAETVRARIVELEASLAAEEKLRATPPPPPPRSEAPRAGRSATLAGIVVGVAGLALVGGGIACGVLGNQAADELSALSRDARPYDPSLARRFDTDRALEGALLGIGAAAVVTGVALVVVGRVAAKRAQRAVAALSW